MSYAVRLCWKKNNVKHTGKKKARIKFFMKDRQNAHHIPRSVAGYTITLEPTGFAPIITLTLSHNTTRSPIILFPGVAPPGLPPP